ncbi:flagellar export chaperone FliS [Alkaliphilus oremlandii]|uniref:Flagellar secretion chaperone FliS n=1 Tax=Alkaliphilus oremlandii (strain OhILAs) TaxID=350688 RepID=A8MJN9_ALKOO|nr:flagellar export chaperone FliS [Alkaliphilus oremlandii]ABW20021.1 flagellar protein FliS [Alkaliphilus oremlandii OhILAs]
MAMNNPYGQYKQNSVMTASPQELTLMLYNGALKFIGMAKINIQEKDIPKANESIKRAQDIIQELNITLNMDYPISTNLRSMYTYILEKLVDGNIYKEIQYLDEAAEIITELRDTWKEAMKISKGGK